MKNKNLLFHLSLAIISMIGIPSCKASGLEDSNSVLSSMSRLPDEIQDTILARLSIEEEGKAASVCKLWHQLRRKHMTEPLRFEREQMLYAPPNTV